MLPQALSDDIVHPSSRTIYINPNFTKTSARGVINATAATIASSNAMTTTTSGAHINPLFLRRPRPPAIHMNPQFLQKKLLEQQLLQLQQQRSLKENVSAVKTEENSKYDKDYDLKKSTAENATSNIVNPRKIISKSRTCIVREPVLVQNTTKPISVPAPGSIIRLSKRKLVRHVTTPTTNASIATAKPKIITAISTTKPATSGKYKLDNRGKLVVDAAIKAATILGVKRRSFVGRYALRRSTSEQVIMRRKVLPISTRTLKSRFKLQSLPINKQLHLLNINGVLYKSTRNKLQRKDTQPPLPKSNSSLLSVRPKINPATVVTSAPMNLARDRTLFVRGTKFVMDANGYKLTRITATPTSGVSGSSQPSVKQRQRIDIGGLTYVASKTQNVFVRTRNHLALAHLNSAKHRSLQLLTSRLVKSNVPCAIYQRVGRCVAHERNRCNKVHDKKQVIICQRFLRSECHDKNCLLSHNVSLSKMPVCKFFLQGVCVRTDCPYLHKKLSTKADICVDFLHGYCKRAEQCNKRHEFICPEYARLGECKIVNCIYCRAHKRKLGQQQTKPTTTTKVEKVSEAIRNVKEGNDAKSAEDADELPLRYFTDKTSMSMSNVTDCGVTDTMHSDAPKSPLTTHQIAADELMAEETTRHARPKIGALPSFIPLS